MEKYLRINMLGQSPRRMKKNLPGCGLTKVEKNVLEDYAARVCVYVCRSACVCVCVCVCECMCICVCM